MQFPAILPAALQKSRICFLLRENVGEELYTTVFSFLVFTKSHDLINIIMAK